MEAYFDLYKFPHMTEKGTQTIHGQTAEVSEKKMTVGVFGNDPC